MRRTLTHSDIERIVRNTEKHCGSKCTDAHKKQGASVADHIIGSLATFINMRPVTDIAFVTNMLHDIVTITVLNDEIEYVTITLPSSEIWCYTHCAGQVALWANRRGYRFTPIVVSE